jgi:flagellar biosynthesis/type III secretory pathway chaperone
VTPASAEVLRLAAELSACLDRESAALAAGKSDALAQTTQHKDTLIDQLQRAARSLPALDSSAQRELAAAMNRCKQQNLANAALLDARVNQVRWALNHLGLGGPAVYGRDGRTQNAFAARSVGSA